MLLLTSLSAIGQSNRYLVFFKDKNGTPHSISQPSTFLSAKAIQRRAHSAVIITPEDLPVTPSYVTQVRATGAFAFFTTRWKNGVLVEADAAQLATLSSLPFVSTVEFIAPGKKLLGGKQKNIKQKSAKASVETTQTQLQMLDLDTMQNKGLRGDGIIISLFDGGFQGVNVAAPFQPVISENRISIAADFVTNSGNVYQFDDHGTQVFSVIAGKLEHMFTGGAYRASYNLFVTEDIGSEYRIEEYNWLLAAEKADSAGTDIIQSSLGYNTFSDPQMDYKTSDLNGKIAVISQAARMAIDRGIIVVVSAGNEGNTSWRLITPPADVDGIISVGAVNSTGSKVGFSSYGPTADGRIKPDVVALGQNTSVVYPDGTVGTASGTSLAAPLVASLAAGLLQAYPHLTPAELVQAIKLSASKANSPDNRVGYGIPNFTAVKNYLESNQSGDDVYIYPNPSSEMLNLAFKQLPDGQVNLSFYDTSGKLLSEPVISPDWQNNPLQISLSNLSAGTYLLKVRTSTIVKTFRFIKL